ncbi:hypothetical protein L209DRAFT_215311 [Thermothelomyces heterothallicus CBS 203.75]
MKEETCWPDQAADRKTPSQATAWSIGDFMTWTRSDPHLAAVSCRYAACVYSRRPRSRPTRSCFLSSTPRNGFRGGVPSLGVHNRLRSARLEKPLTAIKPPGALGLGGVSFLRTDFAGHQSHRRSLTPTLVYIRAVRTESWRAKSPAHPGSMQPTLQAAP